MGDLDQAEGRKTAPDSLDMHRPFGRLRRDRSPPVHGLQKQRKLRRCQHHTAIDQRRPDEAMTLETLGEKAQARTVPDQRLQIVAALAAEQENMPAVRIEPEDIAGKRAQARKALALMWCTT